MKSYAVLWVPDFYLQATLRYDRPGVEQPVALLELASSKQGTAVKPVIQELNAPALRARVQRGMSPTQGLARCPGLRLLSRNTGHERSAQETLLQTAERLSPFLEATRPGAITIELPGERTIGTDELRQTWIEPLAALGLQAGCGVASTPALAFLAARLARPILRVASPAKFLAPLPVAVLEPSPELQSVLDSWGIRTVGEYLALPPAEMGERLGPEAVALRQRLDSTSARPLRWVQPPEFFREQADLEHPVETLEPLLFLLRRFLEEITRRLDQVYQVAGKLRLVLRFETGTPYRQIFTIPQPTSDVDLLFRMLHTHLENFTSEAPLSGLELAAQPVRPQAEQGNLLEPGLRDLHRFADTLARLHALLGSDRVGSPRLEASHRPDAFQLEPFTSLPSSPQVKPVAEPERELPGGAPWLRFRPPLEARVICCETRPVYLHSSAVTTPISETAGPWLSSGHWWEMPPWEREEWAVATPAGCYRLVRLARDWFLEGIYA